MLVCFSHQICTRVNVKILAKTAPLATEHNYLHAVRCWTLQGIGLPLLHSLKLQIRILVPDKIQPTPAPATDDPNAVSRKRDHIELAFQAQIESISLDSRFDYEPLLSAHPAPGQLEPMRFLGKQLRAPIWVSSMTGGTQWAGTINHNLARACRDFGMGMGLGSCRSLLRSDDHLADFDVRSTIGHELPLFANLGVAQVDELLHTGQIDLVRRLIDRLQADGLILHVNPLQEAMQPEGDRFRRPALHTIEALLEAVEFPVIVKEVGQGMGPQSLEALFRLPLAAIDFGASGGTNFAMLELLRADAAKREAFAPLAFVGHSAADMVATANRIVASRGEQLACRQVIISGGIRHFLDGYFLTEKLALPAVYGQASAFLRHARGDYGELATFVENQVAGLALAKAYLRVR
jgi:isopentenyl-diphosphate delta-isomerase